VRIVLDENLWPELATALNAFEQRYDLTFIHINDIALGAQDEDIPDISQAHGAAALVSANVRDFGARRVIFEAMLEAGISVVVLRPSKRATLTPEVQMSMLIRHIQRIAASLRQSEDNMLLKLTEGGVTEISLEQLGKELG
jgi:predicted nuclease of predicted toxin-antitoxin system